MPRCEDFPCCGHEAGDCDGSLYGSDESIKTDPHLLCDHNTGVCQVEEEAQPEDEDEGEDIELDTSATTVRLTEHQLRLALGGLYDLLLETKRYLSPHLDQYPEPTETDTCCAAHQRRYEHAMHSHQLLLEKKSQLQVLIDLFEESIPSVCSAQQSRP